MGRVGPTLRRVASKVKNNSAVPMNISNEDGLPTRCAKAVAGKSGKYIAAVIAKTAIIMSAKGTPSKRYHTLDCMLLFDFRKPKSRKTNPNTNDK